MEPAATFERDFRRRLARGVTATFALFALAAGLRYLSLGLYGLVAVDGALTLLVLASAYVLHDKPTTFAHLLTSSLLAALVVDNSVTGGFYDPNFTWLCVVPMLAGVLLPGWSVLGYGLAVALLTLGFFALDTWGQGVPDLIPAAEHASQSLFNRLAVLASLVALVVVFGRERSRSAEALQGAVTAADGANRAKSEFLANMSHELRTPLTAIIGLSELLLELSPEERAGETEDLGRIRGAARQLLALINEVLDLSKIEAGKLQIVAVPTELGPLVQDLSDTLGTLVRSGNNEWVVDIPEELGVAVIDGNRLGQIVTNLVGNAAKFTQNGQVRLRVARVRGAIEVDVADTGIGIPAHSLEQVFDSFVQVDSSTTRRHGGSGLGLTISRRLARLMGGDITLHSTVGVGSRFVLRVADGR